MEEMQDLISNMCSKDWRHRHVVLYDTHELICKKCSKQLLIRAREMWSEMAVLDGNEQHQLALEKNEQLAALWERIGCIPDW
jgi:hypothetical protein